MNKTSWTLSALLASQVIVIGARGLGIGGGGAGERVGYRGLLFDGVDTDQLGGFTLRKGEEEISLEREGSRWVLRDADSFPAEPEKVDEFLRTLAGLEIAETISSSANYHSSLQVADENALARLTLDGGDKATTVWIGKRAFGDSVYLRVEGSDEVLVVRDFGARDISTSFEDWMLTHPLRRSREMVQAIEIAPKDRASFRVARSAQGWSGSTEDSQFEAGSAGVNKLMAEAEMLKASGLAEEIGGLVSLGTFALEGDRPLRAELFEAGEGQGVIAQIEGLPRAVRFPARAGELLDWAPEDFAAPVEQVDVGEEAEGLLHQGHDH